MKRVGCLYRVSTKKQTYNNDIPMQKEACRNFISTKDDWELTKEYVELGVSGYKLSEEERDVIQTIKKDVSNNEIDILLVFMFDRIGRRDDETPFVVKWLIDKGIEVWSVNEGQREIKTNLDRLINYMTYWQSQGESEKISLRSRERRVQLTKEGIYLGNYAPYGYKMIDSDLYSKIGKRRRILSIYEEEAKVIRLIFNLIVGKKYGTDKVAIHLNENNIKRRKEGCLWDSNIIIEIVRNPIYKGYVSFGKRKRNRDGNIRNSRDEWVIADKQNLHITIIGIDLWEKANKLLDDRRTSTSRRRNLRLLSGYTRCGYCGNNAVPKSTGKKCYMGCKGKQRTGSCEYNKNYKVIILEQIVIKEIKNYLDTYKKIDLKSEISKRNKRIKRREEKIRLIKQKISYSENKIIELKNDTIIALMSGDKEMSQNVSDKYKKEINNLESLKKELKKISKEISNNDQEINELKDYIPKWSCEFENASLDFKRAIMEKLIDKIYLYNDRIEINVKYPISKIIVKEND